MSNYTSQAEGAALNGNSDLSSLASITKVASSVTPPNHDAVDGKPFQTSIKEQPVTEERKPWIQGTNSHLYHSGTARANVAASNEKPDGTTEDNYTKNRSNETVSYAGSACPNEQCLFNSNRSSSSMSITGTRIEME